MKKETIKTILISMRTPQNEPQVNLLLGKIDMLSQNKINQYLSKNEILKETIRIFLEKILKNLITQTKETLPLMICLLMELMEIAYIFIYLEICEIYLIPLVFQTPSIPLI